MPTGKTAKVQRMLTAKRDAIIVRDGFDLLSVYTCEIEEKLRKNKEMATFFENSHDTGPIKLRDAFFGGNF